MYRRFIETAHDHDAALFTNYAMPMLSDMSYSEDAAYTNYRGNWRSYAVRMAGQQALNRPGRPLIVVNTPESLPLPFPPETMQDDSIAYVLHSPFINNARVSLHPASTNDAEAQVRFINRAMPWYQGYYELRNRVFVMYRCIIPPTSSLLKVSGSFH